MKFKKSFQFLNIAVAASLALSGGAFAADLNGIQGTTPTALTTEVSSPFTSFAHIDAQAEAAAEKAAQEAAEKAAKEAAEKAAQEAAAKAAAEKAAQEAAAKAAAEKAAQEAAAKAAALTYTPTYGSSVSYSSSKTASAALKANAVNRGTYKITFYCACSKCCGKSDGITASGTKVKEGRTVAVSTSKIKIGSKLFIEGLGDFIAEDTGVSGYKVDVFVNSHAKAYQLGVRYATVYQLKA